MTRRRFYVPRECIHDGIAALPPDEAHHLRDVLRMKTGNTVEIFDDAGRGYSGEVKIHGSDVIVHGLKCLPSPESRFSLTLAAALIKPANFEWMLQKATELGTDEIIPLKTLLSEMRIPQEKIESRLERWNRIIREASKQCRRYSVPTIRPPLDFFEFLCLEEFSSYTRILFYEQATEPWQSSNPTDQIILCVGPEGGWDPLEIERAREAGFGIFGLGPWTLRAETAAIAAVSIIQHQIALRK
jgi:16S rRNA (uracil1498-N3)-methyltransferase